MNIYILVHEYKQGYSCYAFSTPEKREEAASLLRNEYAKDFERDNDFLLSEDVTLDEMPWSRQGETNAQV